MEEKSPLQPTQRVKTLKRKKKNSTTLKYAELYLFFCFLNGKI